MANPKIVSKNCLQNLLNELLTVDGFTFHPETGSLTKIETVNGTQSVKHLQVNVSSTNWLWDSFNFCT